MNLSLRSLETSNLSADNLKNTDYDGSTPKPTMRVILESGYPVLTAVNWPKHCCPICVFSDAPKLDKKYEIEHCSRSSKTINWSAIWSWDTGQWLPRTQTSLFKTCAQRKAGRRQRARRLADLVFKMAGRVMADEYAIFKISSALFILRILSKSLSIHVLWMKWKLFSPHTLDSSIIMCLLPNYIMFTTEL